jgi:hypothetical protein
MPADLLPAGKWPRRSHPSPSAAPPFPAHCPLQGPTDDKEPSGRPPSSAPSRKANHNTSLDRVLAIHPKPHKGLLAAAGNPDCTEQTETRKENIQGTRLNLLPTCCVLCDNTSSASTSPAASNCTCMASTAPSLSAAAGDRSACECAS